MIAGRARRGSTALLLVLAAGIAATVLGVLAAPDVMSWVSCTKHPAVARVAVSAEIEPAIQRLGRFFNSEHQLVSGHRAEVAVRAASPAGIAAALARGEVPASMRGSLTRRSGRTSRGAHRRPPGLFTRAG
jgi:hypothetical protein